MKHATRHASYVADSAHLPGTRYAFGGFANDANLVGFFWKPFVA